jgi:hypothetical protein
MAIRPFDLGRSELRERSQLAMTGGANASDAGRNIPVASTPHPKNHPTALATMNR